MYIVLLCGVKWIPKDVNDFIVPKPIAFFCWYFSIHIYSYACTKSSVKPRGNASLVLDSWTFLSLSPKLGSNMIFFALTSAGPQGRLKPEPEWRGFQHLPRGPADVIVSEKHVWSLLLYKNIRWSKCLEKVFFRVPIPARKARYLRTF